MSLLQDFIKLGQEIIHSDYESAYGQDYKRVSAFPAVALPQPGFLGHSYRGVVILNQNPGKGNFGSWPDDNRRFGELIRAWEAKGDTKSYDAAFKFFESKFLDSPTWRDYTDPVLRAARITLEDVAVLNLVKFATKKKVTITQRMFDADWVWTQQQLQLLAPSIVVTGGLLVNKQLYRQWPTMSFKVVEQNQVKAVKGETGSQRAKRRSDEANAIGAAIKATLNSRS